MPLEALSELQLTRDQLFIVKLVALRRANVIVAAEAGTGKSRVIQALGAAGAAAGQRVSVTGTTGIAATHLGGGAETLAAWMGQRGRSLDAPEAYVASLQTSRAGQAAADRMRAADVLVVDEMSMLTARQLDALDAGARFARGAPSLAFGGLQVVLLGDMLQLPIVETEAGMAVASAAFARGGFVPCTLRAVFRQADGTFQGLLRAVRRGQASAGHIAALRARVGPAPPDATVILPTNEGVRRVNAERMAAALEAGAAPLRAQWGAVVVCVPGQPARQQGAVRVTHRVTAEEDEVCVRWDVGGSGGGHVLTGARGTGGIGSRIQGLGAVPQGGCRAQTIKCVAATLQALGPATTLDASLVEGGPVLVTANQRGADGALALANGFRGVLAGVDPGGKGLLLDSDTGSGTVLLRPRVARRRAWANAKGYADVIVWWWDVKSAFALTVHKTQGLTLHNIAVDLGPDVFDPQQPYVALSRASSLQGVTVLPGFTAACLTQSRPTRGAAWTRAFDAVLQQRSAEWARHKRARTR